jgi:hypothetical protein
MALAMPSGSRGHGLGHAIGIARRLENPAADAAQHEVIDAAAIEQGGGECDVRAHGEAQKMRALDPGMVHQGEDVARHGLARIFLGLVRLGALAVAAVVERQPAQALAGDRVVPAHALEILVAVGGEAVQQNDRLARIARAEFVIGELQAVRCEVSHLAC